MWDPASTQGRSDSVVAFAARIQISVARRFPIPAPKRLPSRVVPMVSYFLLFTWLSVICSCKFRFWVFTFCYCPTCEFFIVQIVILFDCDLQFSLVWFRFGCSSFVTSMFQIQYCCENKIFNAHADLGWLNELGGACAARKVVCWLSICKTGRSWSAFS